MKTDLRTLFGGVVLVLLTSAIGCAARNAPEGAADVSKAPDIDSTHNASPTPPTPEERKQLEPAPVQQAGFQSSQEETSKTSSPATSSPAGDDQSFVQELSGFKSATSSGSSSTSSQKSK
jgi:hypothetical protein